MHSGLRIFCTIFLFGLACVAPAKAQSSDPASLNFVGLLNSAVKKATASSDDLRTAAQRFCDDLSRSMLDLEAMMKTASADAWVEMDSPQREMYQVAFRRRVIKDCATNASDYLRTTIELAGARSLPNGQKLIGTRGQNSQDGKILMWQVRSKEPGKLLVTDVLIEGRSAILNLREQAGVTLERNPGDVSALIAALEH